jgi:hypothetical protein
MVYRTRSRSEAGGAELAAEACLAAVETGGKGTVPARGGEAPSNLCETKTEGVRLDLERTKWG